MMRATPSRVLVVGEALVDVVHRIDGRVDETPGGSPANVALTLGRLGRAPQLLTQLGDDTFGHSVRAWLEASGVDVLAVTAPRTSTAVAHLDETGGATYEFDIEWVLDSEPAPLADAIHIGSVSALLEPGAAQVGRIVDELRGSALISYDPNIRPALLPDHGAAVRGVELLVSRADVVKVSDEDLRWLYPDRDLTQTAHEWYRSGPALVVVTEGASGAFVVSNSGVVAIDAPSVAVVDTVGAGDTFMGVLLDALLTDRSGGARGRTQIRKLPGDALELILRRCAIAAAITVSRRGADPPTLSELLAHLRGHGAALMKG